MKKTFMHCLFDIMDHITSCGLSWAWFEKNDVSLEDILSMSFEWYKVNDVNDDAWHTLDLDDILFNYASGKFWKMYGMSLKKYIDFYYISGSFSDPEYYLEDFLKDHPEIDITSLYFKEIKSDFDESDDEVFVFVNKDDVPVVYLIKSTWCVIKDDDEPYNMDDSDFNFEYWLELPDVYDNVEHK